MFSSRASSDRIESRKDSEEWILAIMLAAILLGITVTVFVATLHIRAEWTAWQERLREDIWQTEAGS